MKKMLLISLLFSFVIGRAEIHPDSVVMTIAGNPVSLAEFEFIAKKNNEVDFSDNQSVQQYVELFKNFKLKVTEAEARGLDRTGDFRNELSGYRSQLISSYLSDKIAEEEYVKKIYDRQCEILDISQILIPLPPGHLSKDTLAAYQEAVKIYERILAGTDIDELGAELNEKSEQEESPIRYRRYSAYTALQSSKAFDEIVYNMTPGETTGPVRTMQGFHIIKLNERRPDPGVMKVAQIMIALEKDSKKISKAEALKKAEDIYQKAIAGEDFGELAKKYSDDETGEDGGILPFLGPGMVLRPFEDAAFALENPGDISKPVETEFGYFIIKLIEKKPVPSLEQRKTNLFTVLGQGEHNFELYKAYDQRLRKEYNYTLNPEAYAEIQKICDTYFPGEAEFYEETKKLDKVLFTMGDEEFPQKEFGYYLLLNPLSVKTYSGDFLQEVYDLFVREIANSMERENLYAKYPEINHLMQEYRDGILLFEISNQEIWSKPIDEQTTIENSWLKELEQKYPVEINWVVLKKINKN